MQLINLWGIKPLGYQVLCPYRVEIYHVFCAKALYSFFVISGVILLANPQLPLLQIRMSSDVNLSEGLHGEYPHEIG
jgi:hypothetical protein